MADHYSEDPYAWSFPDINSDGENEEGVESEYVESYDENGNSNNPNADSNSNKSESELAIDKLTKTLTAEYEEKNKQVLVLKSEYEEKSTAFKNLFYNLQNSKKEFDKELIGIIESIIKKVVKNIIQKQIEVDPSIMSEVVAQLTGLIQPSGGIVTIFMSEDDYKNIYIPGTTASPAVCVDPNLNRGDVIVKSNFAEIRAILNERIDQVIGVEHV